jgi:hypothetical protein
MKRNAWIGLLAGSFFSATIFPGPWALAGAQSDGGAPRPMPSGQIITPLAPTGAVFSRLNPGLKDFPSYTVGQAVKTVISPDGNTLLILTSATTGSTCRASALLLTRMNMCSSSM